MDTLRNYLKNNSLSIELFAYLADLSYFSVWKALNGKKIGPLVCRKIYHTSNGEVDFGIAYKSRKSYIKSLPRLRKRRGPNPKEVCSKTKMG
jgi:hypothetical protein